MRFPAAKGPPRSEVAYAFEWHGQYAARALNRLHKAKIRAKVSPRRFSAQTADGTLKFDRGTIVIPVGLQKEVPANTVHRVLKTIAARDGIVVHSLTSGLTPTGNDLGSPSMRPLIQPKPLLLVGKGVSAYEAGEVWHLLDQRHDLEVTLVDLSRLGSVDLHDFTHLLIVNGKYDLGEKRVAAIKRWIEEGGILIATKAAAKWASKSGIGATRFVDEKEEKKKDEEFLSEEDKDLLPTRRLPYEDHQHDRDSKLTKGTIFATNLDLSHPLGFGYLAKELAVFRNSNLIMRPSMDPYATVAQYTDNPLLAGYVHEERLEKISGSAAIVVERLEDGAVISFADNPNFRAFWTGTSKAYLNALFFGSAIEKTELEDEKAVDSDQHKH
jgi:hypothetical protein